MLLGPAQARGEVDEVVFHGGPEEAADDVFAGMVREGLNVCLIDAGALEREADTWNRAACSHGSSDRLMLRMEQALRWFQTRWQGLTMAEK